MTANELRIGNYVYDTLGKVNKIDLEAITYIVKEPHNQVKPIPLTEEWLLKLGFEKNKDNRWMRGKSRYAIFYFEYYATGEDNCMWRIEYHDTDYGRNEYKDCNQWGDVIKYVNQLQNLYFALTGEELTIKC
jgi:hypothetical protein